jgi:EmrB/QacA subfamily drug resistance transporter
VIITLPVFDKGNTGAEVCVTNTHEQYPVIVKRVVLLIAALSSFITPFDGSAVNIALPSIENEFLINAITLSWISTAYLLSSAVFLVPFGKFGDFYGRKRLFVAGIALFAVSSLLVSLSMSPEMLIAMRFIQGIGSAMIFGTSMAILSAVFQPGERGRAIGISIMAVYLGLSLGPVLGGYMTAYLGWRSIFLINVPLGIIVIILTTFLLKDEWKEGTGSFDLKGSVIYGLSLSGIIYGLSLGPVTPAVVLVLAGVLGIILFIWFEQRQQIPILDITLFRKSRVFLFSNLAALINYSATFAVTFLMSIYLQISKGFGPEQSGLILVAQPLMQALFAPISGKLSDRIEPGLIASAGMGLCALGLFLLVFLDAGSGLPFIIACLLLLGCGFGLFSSPNTNAIMSSVEKRYYGVASGMVGTMRLLGQTFSMGVTMMIFAIIIGEVSISADNSTLFLSSMHTAFVFFTILCLLGIGASMIRGRLRTNTA